MTVNAGDGKIVRDQKVFHVDKPQEAHPFNSYASPTPVAEPGRVYVTFGSLGTAALDSRTGKVLWRAAGSRVQSLPRRRARRPSSSATC